MTIIPEVQERLITAFPKSSDAALYRAVQEGIYLADHLSAGESFLNNKLAVDIRGHLRRVGIAHQIGLYCTRGELPFVTEIKPMPRGRWHWLEIKSTGAVAHVCRTDDVMKFPDEAESRQDYRLSLQPTLLTWMTDRKPMAQVIQEIPKLYAWLTFRAAQDGRVSHLCWGAPAADPDIDLYIGHINVLERIAHAGADIPQVSSVPDPKEKLRLKDHIEKALEKRDDEKRE